jgi:hypothetical protein
MKKTTLKVAGFFFALALLHSCKKSEITSTETLGQTEKQTLSAEPVIDNNRLVFSSHKEFYKFVDRIDNNDPAVAVFLLNKKGFTSLYSRISAYNLTDEDMPESLNQYLEFGLPESFQKVLNSDGEIEIGNQIVWYHNGFKYFINKADKAKLNEIKNNPTAADVEKISVGSKVIPVNTLNETGARTWMGLANGPDARHQREFWQNAPAAGNRKYVHEIQAYTDAYFDGVFYVWNTRVILRIKMEWKGKKWKPAGETREISYNLTCNNVLYAPPFAYVIPPNAVLTGGATQSGDFQVMVAQANGSGTFGGGSGWDVELRGTIYQHVVGDSQSNEWFNTGNPLW